MPTTRAWAGVRPRRTAPRPTPVRRSASSGCARPVARAVAQMRHNCHGSGLRASQACQNTIGFSSVMRQTSAVCHTADAGLRPARIGKRWASVTAPAAGSAAPIAPRCTLSRVTRRPARHSRACRAAVSERSAKLAPFPFRDDFCDAGHCRGRDCRSFQRILSRPRSQQGLNRSSSLSMWSTARPFPRRYGSNAALPRTSPERDPRDWT